LPHHVTQRGNGGARTFFRDDDYGLYRDLLARHTREAGVEVWAWVLMPNHVHLVLNPSDPDGPRRALSRIHRAYAGYIHARRRKTGHFWQGRYGSVVVDEAHLAAAVRYVALNPVRARLVERAEDWRWSSARAHARGEADGVTRLDPVRDRFPRFGELLADAELEPLAEALRKAETTGRPVGSPDFLAGLEAATQRVLLPKPRGPKPAADRARS
jgi:putative transposase